MGNKFILPLFDAELVKKSSYKLCNGLSIKTLSSDYEEYLINTPELIARRKSSLKFMKCGLVIEPDKLKNGENLNSSQLMEFGVFIAMTIRLATGIPVDIPYWFDVDGKDIKGCGNTLVQTFRTENRYMYSLDDGIQSKGLDALKISIDSVADKHILEKNKNVLIRAIEFAGIAFQSRHMPSRLVNNTIFLESLFSCANTEIAFQIASSVSWYLKACVKDTERVELFSQVKDLYNFRSKIVHGADISTKSPSIKRNMVFSETINTEIFQKILEKKHISVFSLKQDKRQEELKLLMIGAQCKLIDTCT